MTPFAKFLSVNGLKRKDIAAFLGVSGAFITQISSGARKLPDEKLAIIKANAYGWDTSMLEDKTLSGMDRVREQEPVSQEQLRSTVLQVMEPAEKFHIEYLERKVNDQESLIRELYQQIGSLTKELELARKGETASHVGTSSVAHVG
jgi:transcriptional regulator with XRE-family HTH domain